MRLNIAQKNDYERAVATLYGLLSGITADYELSDSELCHLQGWIEIHGNLLDLHPFKELNAYVNQVLEDQVVDQCEREELVEWCQLFLDSSSDFLGCVDRAIRRLHGYLHAIAQDNQVTKKELIDLNDWLQDYQIFQGYFPFSGVFEFLKQVLDDGVVTQEECDAFLMFAQAFQERRIEDPKIGDVPPALCLITDAPILESFTLLCEDDAHVVFESKCFCFTGLARCGSRNDLHNLVKSLGGSFRKTITQDVDYLVIGAQSAPAWKFSTYGRKIQQALDYKCKWGRPAILHEDYFLTFCHSMP